MPKISIIVPVYNVEAYLDRCVQSVLNQTFTDFELILVDDGSPDNCPAMCDEYVQKDTRVVVIHQENGGLSAARNVGIDWAFANSDSEWLAFIDSDDWIHPQYLELMYQTVIHYQVNICECKFLATSSEADGKNLSEDIDVKRMSSEELYCLKDSPGKRCYPTHNAWGKLINKELFRCVRFPVNKLNEDLYTMYKPLFAVNEACYIDFPLYYYYLSPTSLTRVKWHRRKLDEVTGYKELLFFLKKNGLQKAIIRTVQLYIEVCLSYQISELLQLPSKDNNKALCMLRRELRYTLLKYRKESGFTLANNTYYYELAFPNIMKLYWLFRGVWSKRTKKQ